MKKTFIAILSVLVLTACGNPISDETASEITATKTTVPATLTVQKFLDFQCGYCREASATMKELKAHYADKITIEYKHYPVKRGSQQIAEAAECARDQEKFAEFSAEYFTSFFGRVGETALVQVSDNIGLDSTKFQLCLNSGVKKSVVQADIALGKKYGIRAVPHFIVGTESLAGAYSADVFKKLIDEQLTE